MSVLEVIQFIIVISARCVLHAVMHCCIYYLLQSIPYVAKAWQALTILVEKLKPKGSKLKTTDRLHRIICVSEVSMWRLSCMLARRHNLVDIAAAFILI